MATHDTHSLTHLVQQAAQATQDVLRKYARRLQGIGGTTGASADPVGMRWSKELLASQARVELRDIHRRIARVIRTLQLRDVITEGEVRTTEERFEQMLRESLKTVDESGAHVERPRDQRTRRPSSLPQGNRAHAKDAGRAREASSR